MAILLLLAGGSITASASPIVYVVNGLFDDGTTFTGSFVLDGPANTLVSSDITTLDGPTGGLSEDWRRRR